jgi:hypothetical protein
MKKAKNLQTEKEATMTNIHATKIAKQMIENGEARTQKEAAKLLAEWCDLAPSTIEKKITAGKKELAVIDQTDNEIDLDVAVENRLINDDQNQDKEVTGSDNPVRTEFNEEHVKLATKKVEDDYLSAKMLAKGIRKVCHEIVRDIVDVKNAIRRFSIVENDNFDKLYCALEDVIDKMCDIAIDANVDEAVKKVIYASLNHTDDETRSFGCEF